MLFNPIDFDSIDNIDLIARDDMGKNALMFALNYNSGTIIYDYKIPIEVINYLVMNSNPKDVDRLNQNALMHALKSERPTIDSGQLSHLIKTNDLSVKNELGVPALYSIFIWPLDTYPALDIINKKDLLYLIENTDLNCFINRPVPNCQKTFLMKLISDLKHCKNLDIFFEPEIFEAIIAKTDLTFVNDIGQSCASQFIELPSSSFIYNHLSDNLKAKIQFDFHKYSARFISSVPLHTIARSIIETIAFFAADDFTGPFDNEKRQVSFFSQSDFNAALKEVFISKAPERFQFLEALLNFYNYKKIIKSQFNTDLINRKFIDKIVSKLDYECASVTPRFFPLNIEHKVDTIEYIDCVLALPEKVDFRDKGKDVSPDRRWHDLNSMAYYRAGKTLNHILNALDINKINQSWCEYFKAERDYNGPIHPTCSALLRYFAVYNNLKIEPSPELAHSIIAYCDTDKVLRYTGDHIKKNLIPFIEELKIIAEKHSLETVLILDNSSVQTKKSGYKI